MVCATPTTDNRVQLGRVWIYQLAGEPVRGRGRHSKWRMSFLSPACGTQRTVTLGFMSQRAAFKVRHEKLAELSDQLRNNDFLSWSEWVDYDTDRMDGCCSVNYHNLLCRCLATFGYILPTDRLAEVSLRDILNFRSERARDGLSHTSINTEMRVVLASLHRAVDHGFLMISPIDTMRARGRYNMLFLKEYRKTVKVPSPEEYGRLLAVSPHLSFDALLQLAWWAGLRCGEALALRWDEINFKDNYISVSVRDDFVPKGGKGRKIPLVGQLRDFLLTYRSRTKPGKFDYIVTSTTLHTHKLLRVRDVSANVSTLMRRAGLINDKGRAAFSLHKLRAACITRWFLENHTIDDVQRWAGHTDLRVTVEHYKAASLI